MLYREAGQFKTSYAADQAIFPLAQDRWFVAALLLAAYIVPPVFLIKDERATSSSRDAITEISLDE